MGRYHRGRERFVKDMVICGWHEEYAELDLIEALQTLREQRGEYV